MQPDISVSCDISLPDIDEKRRVWQLLTAKGCDPSNGYVVIAPYANTARDIPGSIVEAAAHYIKKRYGVPCILAGQKKLKFVGWSSGSLSGVLYDATGETSLMELAALLQGARMVLATDSGPMHMACALGTPTVALFSSGNWRLWTPRRHCRLITLDVACSPCKRETAEACPTQECIKRITMDPILREIDACFQYGSMGCFPKGWDMRLFQQRNA